MTGKIVNIRQQQILHFMLIVFMTLCFFILLYFSDKNVDNVRKIWDLIAYLVSGGWAVMVFIMALLTDEQRVIDKIGYGYRMALNNKIIIVCLNLLFLLISGALSYELFAYRQVEIHYDYNKIIILEMTAPESRKIGQITFSKPIKVRLKTGIVELYYYSVDDREKKLFPGSKILTVKPFWQPLQEVHLNVI